MIIKGLCKCGHLESEHEYKGEASPCTVKCYDENTGLLSWHCPCYKFVNVIFCCLYHWTGGSKDSRCMHGTIANVIGMRYKLQIIGGK